MNTEAASDYARRIINARGQGVMDVERTIIYCYDNPPRKPLEKQKGERTRPIYFRQKVFACLLSIAKAQSLDTGETWSVEDVADALLCGALKDLAPKAWEMHVRHEAEAAKLLDELRRNGTDVEHNEIMEAQ